MPKATKNTKNTKTTKNKATTTAKKPIKKETVKNDINVLFAIFEAVPFMKTGGLGDVGGSMPFELKKAGVNVRVIMPKFDSIAEEYKERMVHVTDFYVPLGWRNLYCGIEKLMYKGLTFYFIDNEYYFHRGAPYGFFDDGERIAFFAKAVVEAMTHLPRFKCDILHCNDWHTSLAPVFLREFYHGDKVWDNVKTVLTVHNLKFQGKYSDYVLGDVLGLNGIKAAEDQLRCDKDTVNYLRGGLSYTDAITMVSPTYAEEVKNPFFGEGLQDVLCRRQSIMRGILNGIDKKMYDPEKDKAIKNHFSADDMSGKAICKRKLQKELGLAENADIPVIAMIGRLTSQKGCDLVMRVFREIMGLGAQFIILGTGDKKYEDALKGFAYEYGDNFKLLLRFDEALSHRIYAGADMFLMPSVFEPCGLSQMISMAYGTLPIVRETGGLKDTVHPYNKFTGEGNGFSFAHINAHEMLFTLKDAVALYRENKEAWKKLQETAMKEDFSWDKPSIEYKKLYEELLGR